MHSLDAQPLPSSLWQGRETLAQEPDLKIHKQILEFLARINLVSLCRIASTLRSGIESHISERFIFGTENVIREIVFEDGVVWIARCYFRPVHRGMVRSEVATMRHVKKHTTIPVPEVFAYSSSCDNAVGSPYILMETIRGRRHINEDLVILDIPDEKKRFVCEQLADYFLQLNSLRFPSIGSLDTDEEGNLFISDVFRIHETFPRPTGPTQYYRFAALARLRLFRHVPSLAFNSWLRLSLAKRMGKSTTVDYPLAHPDFHAGNILFDDDFTIVGILDWSYAHTVPTELFCVVPGGWFLRPDSFLDDVPPAFRAGRERFHELQKSLRQEFLSALQELEKSRGTEPRLSLMFKDIKTKQALMFNEYYESKNSEVYELAFGKPARVEDLKELREWFFEQDLDMLLDQEEGQAYSLSDDGLSTTKV